MRCPDCNKFASLELSDDIEVTNLEVENDEGDGRVLGNIRIVLNCVDCGSEMKEANFDIEQTIELKHTEDCPEKGASAELEVEFDPSGVDEFDPPKAKRQKHLYGAEGTILVKCPACKASASSAYKETVQSSHMEELV